MLLVLLVLLVVVAVASLRYSPPPLILRATTFVCAHVCLALHFAPRMDTLVKQLVAFYAVAHRHASLTHANTSNTRAGCSHEAPPAPSDALCQPLHSAAPGVAQPHTPTGIASAARPKTSSDGTAAAATAGSNAGPDLRVDSAHNDDLRRTFTISLLHRPKHTPRSFSSAWHTDSPRHPAQESSLHDGGVNADVRGTGAGADAGAGAGAGAGVGADQPTAVSRSAPAGTPDSPLSDKETQQQRQRLVLTRLVAQVQHAQTLAGFTKWKARVCSIVFGFAVRVEAAHTCLFGSPHVLQPPCTGCPFVPLHARRSFVSLLLASKAVHAAGVLVPSLVSSGSQGKKGSRGEARSSRQQESEGRAVRAQVNRPKHACGAGRGWLWC